MLSNSLGSQQESVELNQELGAIFKKISKDRLEDIMPPATVIIQKGRPKGTKRDKLGVEYEDKKIKEERKEEKKRRKIDNEGVKKEKKLTVAAFKAIEKK